MRRPVVAISSLVLVFSGLGISPANAVADGSYPCGTSGTYSIAGNQVVDSLDNCVGLVVIPSGITRINDSSFESTDISSISIPASVTEIGNFAFASANLLTSVTFANGSALNTIGSNAFSRSGITSIALPEGLLTIDDEAFDSSALTSINLPASLTTLGNAVFYESELTSITFSPGFQITTLSDELFRDSALSSISIPSSITTIYDRSFIGTRLTSITIPASVTSIGNRAFEEATLLANVYMLGNAPTVGQSGGGAFADVASNPVVHIKATATGFPSVGSDWNGLTVATGVYAVAFNSNGGSLVAPGAFATGGALATPETPARSGHTFAGWSATDGGSAVTFPYSPGVNSDITLFAKWTLNASSAVVAKSPATFGKTIQFSTSSKALTKAHKAALKKSVTTSGKDATYVVTGTAGLLPGVTAAQAKTLAKARANAVKAYLVKLGVNKANITVKTKVTNQGIAPKTKTLASYLTS
jgi:uncharacterized repeat protein (TIGR02543 family)